MDPSDGKNVRETDEVSHLVAIEGGWSLWRLICLRSTGFPVTMLEPLGSPAAARAIDAVASTASVDPSRQREANDISASEIARIGRHVRELARDPRFREAITWQNRSALSAGIAYLLRQPEGVSNAEARKNELLIARYAQRYCAKNDTIGFFGPIGWGRIHSDGPPVWQRPGPSLLARRHTYFEHWTIDELARALSADPLVKPCLRPRRHPTARIDGTTLWDGRLRRTEIPPAFARLLAACDGSRTACDIARELVADVELELDGEEEVYELLAELVDKNLAFWTLETPTLAPHPERSFRQRLDSATAAAKERALTALGELEEGRAAAANVVGDPDRLDAAFAALEEVFERLTERPAVRGAGTFYAGRRLVYEDCTRDTELRLGPLFLERLSGPLELVLHSARWYTWAIAQLYLDAFRQIYERLRTKLDSPEVEYLHLWEEIAPLFPNGDRPAPLVADVVAELRRRWGEVLALTAGERRARRSVEELRPRVHEIFRAPGPGWPWARYQSPDVLIGASGPDAAARGDFFLVLGELHTAVHSYVLPTYVELSPDGHAMVRMQEADIQAPCVFPITGRRHATRVDFASLSERDLDLEVGDTPSHRAREHVLAVADLVAAEENGRLTIRTRDRRHVFDALAFFGYYLSAECAAHFKFLPDGPHGPRISIDHLVIARERWTFPRADLSFCDGPSGRHERFAAARRWALAHDLPRFVFLKVPEEPKPIYVDLESPLYVELMARTVRKSSSVSITEMMPNPDECWLVDRQGARYTSELRIAAVDPIPWTAAVGPPHDNLARDSGTGLFEGETES